MLAAPPARLLRRIVPLIPLVFYGCSDAAAPVAPRIDARPHALEASVIVVTNTDDSGPGSLRRAIGDATDGSVIQFDPSIAGQTIVLTTTSLPITRSLTIEGPAAQGMTISGNLSTSIFDILGGTVVLRNVSLVNGNSVSGGALVMGNADVTLDHVLVANNQGRVGGILMEKDVATLVLVNSTVSGNVGAFTGGIEALGSVIIRNSTIAGNVGPTAGGLDVESGTVSLRNAIIADNADANGGNLNCRIDTDASILSSGRNLSTDNTCGSGAAYIVGNARLAPLASNDGPTRTHALTSDSPAIDAGTACTEANDQRYITRPQGPSCDIGAFEFTDYGTYAITLGPNVAVNVKTGVITLTGTISCSKPTALELTVGVSQTQKTTGRFTTIVQAAGSIVIPSCGTSPSSWSVPLTPSSGKFEPGTATGTAETTISAVGFLRATVTSALKVFQVK